MKNLLFTLISILAFAGCTVNDFDSGNPEDKRGTEDIDILYQNIQKIIVTGLPALTRHGADVQVEIGYFPFGVSTSSIEQSFILYSESGSTEFPEGIDVYWQGMIPPVNPPEYFFPSTYDGNTLTIHVEKRETPPGKPE